MDDLYHLLIGSAHLSVVNAALLGIIFFFARQRYTTIVEEFCDLKKSIREFEQTLRKHGLDIERED